MRRHRIIGITLLTLFLNTVCIAQQSVDQVVNQRIKEKDVPGFAFIIGKNGKIIEQGYRGLSNVELGVPVTEKSVFAIASMSKAYTAAATLLLMEAGLLSPDDRVTKYIPEAPKSWDAITIWHLLTHSSGLVDDWGLYSWDESNELFLKAQSDSSFLQHLFDHELKFKPGTGTFYSSGPFVLGVVIERITGKYYGEYLQQFIFNPLSLSETYVDHPYKLIPNRVSGYFDHDTTEMDTGISGRGNGILISPVAYGRADVGIRTTAKDLMTFMMPS
ncbi:serine hydrolase domain-containing protein [Ekhidna sp.]|uniref:serine hydrolase domain-containing protein n=1 Tax=Ekhidna sp. TaxID=2608089 RepID=UPI003299ED52